MFDRLNEIMGVFWLYHDSVDKVGFALKTIFLFDNVDDTSHIDCQWSKEDSFLI